jgi:hypothetical protein
MCDLGVTAWAVQGSHEHEPHRSAQRQDTHV